MKFFPILFLVFLLSQSKAVAQYWISPVPLVPNSSIQEIALATYSDSLNSYVIEYNPDMAYKAGPFVTSYFQAHEYGHLHRSHLSKRKLLQTGQARLQSNQEMERAADIYAFQTLFAQDRSIILAMIDYLKTTSQEDLTAWPRATRATFLQELFEYNSAVENLPKVQCLHKAHDRDSFPCMHFDRDGKALHQEDPIPCTHQAHPNGDPVPGGVPLENPLNKKRYKAKTIQEIK